MIAICIVTMIDFQVILGQLCTALSVAERATMCQLRNLIKRTNVHKYSQDNMNAAEDYFLWLLHTNVITTAKTIMKFNPQTSVTELAKLITDNFMHWPQIDASMNDPASNCGNIGRLYVYTADLVSLGILWYGFFDSIKEVDREKRLKNWKFLLVIIKATRHCNYAKEAVNLFTSKLSVV